MPEQSEAEKKAQKRKNERTREMFLRWLESVEGLWEDASKLDAFRAGFELGMQEGKEASLKGSLGNITKKLGEISGVLETQEKRVADSQKYLEHLAREWGAPSAAVTGKPTAVKEAAHPKEKKGKAAPEKKEPSAAKKAADKVLEKRKQAPAKKPAKKDKPSFDEKELAPAQKEPDPKLSKEREVEAASKKE